MSFKDWRKITRPETEGEFQANLRSRERGAVGLSQLGGGPQVQQLVPEDSTAPEACTEADTYMILLI